MFHISKLIAKIIPLPANRENRDGFSNEKIIDGLTEKEKKEAGEALVNMLATHPGEMLIVTTLAYLKYQPSSGMLYQLLEASKRPADKVTIAASLYEMSQDDKLIDIAISETTALISWWDLTDVFYFLAKFKNPRMDDFIRTYFNHREYLVAYNAKRAMGQQ